MREERRENRMEKKRILVVDDDEEVCNSFKQLLELRGYSVDVAKTGREAIEKSNANFYNLALLDIRLPDMDGTELLTKMRDTIPKMVKIMVTGYPALDNVKDAINKGANGYIVKPAEIDELLRTVKEHLDRQDEERKYSEKKVAEFIESRYREDETKPTKN